MWVKFWLCSLCVLVSLVIANGGCDSTTFTNVAICDFQTLKGQEIECFGPLEIFGRFI